MVQGADRVLTAIQDTALTDQQDVRAGNPERETAEEVTTARAQAQGREQGEHSVPDQTAVQVKAGTGTEKHPEDPAAQVREQAVPKGEGTLMTKEGTALAEPQEAGRRTEAATSSDRTVESGHRI